MPHNFIFSATRPGKTDTMKGLVFANMTEVGALAFSLVDAKKSTFYISRRTAKKRLTTAGLTNSQAKQVIDLVAGQWMQSHIFTEAMKHHKRHSGKWFPFDVFVDNDTIVTAV